MIRIANWFRRSPASRRKAISKAERRRRKELLIPLEVGRLEERRVLSASPVITGANPLSKLNQGQTNSGNTVSSLYTGFATSTNGIAISSVSVGSQSGGSWSYSTNNGSTWTPFPTIPNGMALLLLGTDKVQFQPNSSFSGSPASITFYAWSGNGTDTSVVTSGGSDFSSNTEASSINFYAGPSLTQTGGGGGQLISDSQTTEPFNNGADNVSVSESNDSDLLSITITQELTNGGTTDSGLVRGRLSGGGFASNNGTYTLDNVTAAQANTALNSLVFTPATGTAGVTVSTFFGMTVTDSYSQSVSNTAEVDVKSPPQLNGSNTYNAIAENTTPPAGIEVVNLLIAVDSTDSSLGMAVTGVTGTGNWQYSTDGTHWVDISPNTDQVSSTNAFLLDSGDQVRFSPSNGYVGTATLTYLAWDGTFGTHHTDFDPTQSSALTAFSVDSATTSEPAYPVFTIDAGTPVSAVYGQSTPITPFSGMTIGGDSDSTDTLTVTITQQTSAGGPTDLTFSRGRLSVSGTAGIYTLTGTPSAVQSALQALVFTPAGGTAGASLTTTFDVSVTSALSNSSTASNDGTAVAVKSPPILSGANNLPTIPTGTTNPTGTQVSTVAELIAGETTDPSDSTLGIAVTSAPGSVSTGNWQYSTDGSHWTDIPTVSATSAFLLNNGDSVRFMPASGFGGTESISFLAWDGSAGTAHNTFDPTGSGAFSPASATASVTVYPVITIGGTGPTAAVGGASVQLFNGASISDNDASDTLTITITQISGGVTDLTFANGTLSSTGVAFSSDANGIYTFTGVSLANASTILDALEFNPTPPASGSSLSTTFEITVSNAISSSSTASDSQTVVTVSAPTLNSATNFNPIAAETTSAGMEVSSIVNSTPAGEGMAIEGLVSAGGTWQYQVHGSTMWVAIPTTVSTSAVFLLNPNDSVRFESGGSGNAALASITFLAWDGNIGRAHSAPTDPANLASAVSTGSATTSITVYPVLSITGTNTTATTDDATSSPFDSHMAVANIGDTDTGETLKITITQQTGGATDSSLTNGSLSSSDNFAGFVNNGNGTYTLTVTASDATAELQNLVFTPNAGPPGQTVNTTFALLVQDSSTPLNDATDSNTVLQVLSVNPPMLTSSAPLPSIPENTGGVYSDVGIKVDQLPIGAGASSGIAVTAIDDTNGTWEYSTDDSNWTAIPTAIGLTPPPPAMPAVFLLAANDYVRFLPNSTPGFTGTATITYLAWNQGSGRADHLANPTNRLLQHGLSSNTETASVLVYPILSIANAKTSTSLDDQTSMPFSTVTIGDTLSENVTLTITQSAMADGTLSGAGLTNNDDGTYTLSGTAAQVQSDLEQLVFTPVLHQVADGDTAQTQFTLQLTDTGFNGVNTVTNPVTKLTVTGTTPPVLNGATNFSSIPENDPSTSVTGMSVADLLGTHATDADGHALGIAVIGAADSSTTGTWDYSTDGTTWSAIPTVSATSAFLLAPGDFVRFAPSAGFFGTATIQFLAWDQTVGMVAETPNLDPTALPGSGAFSTASATSTIQVVAPATITVTTPLQTTDDKTAINVFAQAFGAQPGVTDPNTPTQLYTITITQTLDTGATDTTLADGSLSGGGFVNNHNGTYTLTGVTAAEANTDLAALVFTPKVHKVKPGLTVTTGFTIVVNDGINSPTSNNAITLVATAKNDPPTFAVTSATYNLPVLAANNATVGPAVATEIDVDPQITYTITGGNSSNAYGIDSNGNIYVLNNAALTFSTTPTVLTITATNMGANGIAPASATTTRTVALWQILESATPIGADSTTSLTVTLQTAGTVSVPVTVSWDDGSINAVTLSTASPTATLSHLYAANPDKSDPAASIPITVSFPAAGQVVQAQTVAQVDGTGIGIAVIPQTTSAFVEVISAPQIEVMPAIVPVDPPSTEQVDAGVAPPQATVQSQREVTLRIISPTDQEDPNPIQVPDTDLGDLPSLFKKLPDGHYRVYLSENGRSRVVLDVIVRQGRPVDASETSADEGDRPPASQPTSQIDTNQADGLAGVNPNAAGQETAIPSNPQQPTPAGASSQNPSPTNPLLLNPNQQNTGPANPAPSGPVAGHGKHTAYWQPMHSSGSAARVAMIAGSQVLSSSGVSSAGRWAAVAASSLGAGTAIAIGADLASTEAVRTDAMMERLNRRVFSKSARLSRRLRKLAISDANDENR